MMVQITGAASFWYDLTSEGYKDNSSPWRLSSTQSLKMDSKQMNVLF
jgi:hypothetical protein